MDPVTAIGLASAVVQFVDVGVKVTKRLVEYVNASPGDVPRSLAEILIQLPLLTKSLSTIKDDNRTLSRDEDTKVILHGVVLGCLKLTQELDQIAFKIAPKPGESLSARLKKVLSSLKTENRVSEIERGLGAYVQVLVLHQVVNPADVPVGPPADVTYYEVKELRVDNAVRRPALTAKLHDAFRQASRSQLLKPEFAVLTGKEGIGKTQLALEYCEEARTADHFRAVFWLDASSPKSLERGLESASVTVRRTRSGTTGEKLEFLRSFLTDSWHSWLLVLDDFEPKAFEASPLASSLPAEGHGAILIITRTPQAVDAAVEIRVHGALTKADFTSWRYDVTDAVRAKDLNTVEQALANGFDANSLSADAWQDEGRPLIQFAAKCGFAEAVKLFLDNGARVHFEKGYGNVLSSAVSSGDHSTFKAYMDYETKTGYRMEDDQYATAVARAVIENNLDMLTVLLSQRGDKVSGNSDALARAWEGNHCLEKAAEAGYSACLRLMVDRRKLPESVKYRASILSRAVTGGQVEIAKYLITDIGCDPNETDVHGNTALVLAVGKSEALQDTSIRHAIITLLLDAGAAINKMDRYRHTTPLHMAAKCKLVPTTRLLLDHGADPSIETDTDANVLSYCMGTSSPEIEQMLLSVEFADPGKRQKYYGPLLFRACRQGNRELVVQLLPQTDVNAVEEKDGSGETPLIAAILHKQLAMARMLVRKGARQDARTRDGKSPLRLAAERDMYLLIRDLARAKDSPGVDEPDARGFTPLMAAAREGHVQAVRMLLELGADRDAVNEFGEVALDIAEEVRNAGLVDVLTG